MPRYALLLAYDGSDFCGWQASEGRRSVQAELRRACSRLGIEDAIEGCSRTDAGVHARGQVALLRSERVWQPAHLALSLNHHLPPDCCCRAAAELPPEWRLTEQVSGKHYSYRLDLGSVPNPFLARTGYRPARLPPGQRLQDLARLIPGSRDWRGFARRGESRDDLVRTISRCHWQLTPPTATCHIHGEGFIYRLVRSLVGAQIAVATGTCSEQQLQAALAGEQSPAGRQQAPARGLCLESIAMREQPAWQAPA